MSIRRDRNVIEGQGLILNWGTLLCLLNSAIDYQSVGPVIQRVCMYPGNICIFMNGGFPLLDRKSTSEMNMLPLWYGDSIRNFVTCEMTTCMHVCNAHDCLIRHKIKM